MIASRPFTGRTVLLLFVGFFGLIVAINITFIYYAEHSFPGLSDPNAYEHGLEYNKVLEAAKAQHALGWHVALSAAPETRSLILSVRDANGNPIDDARVTAQLYRPAEATDDRHVDLAPAGSGLYRAEGVFVESGNWNVTVRIHRQEGADYIIEQHLWVP